ncbi:HsdM family class I SAM-dependent methyltransferase [Gordonia malaquae]|uniref:HsdM family class I SAM-dependent methyltransferase n=1 Tax=Gordonia malaquae TaxID=410332 RepID=UPI00301890EB
MASDILELLRNRIPVDRYFDVVGAVLVAEFLYRGPAEGLSVEDSPVARSVDLPPRTLSTLTPAQAREAISFAATAERFRTALNPLIPGHFEMVDDSETLPEIAVTIAALASDVPAAELIAVLDQAQAWDSRRNPCDPSPLSRLIADLVDSMLTEHGSVVLDPAVGAGNTLIQTGLKVRDDIRLVGVDVDKQALANLERRAILSQQPVDVRFGNSLGVDPADDVLADAVVTTPPWSLRDFGDDFDPNDARWVFGRPRPRSDGVWLQHAIAHLESGGRAYVVTPQGELFRKSSEALRHELIRQGAIEAVISLPEGLFTHYAAIKTALWVLARPGETRNPDRVFLGQMTSHSQGAASDLSGTDVMYAYSLWRQGEEAENDSNYVIASARELLVPDSTLLPATWLSRRDAPGPDKLVEEIQTIAERLSIGPVIGTFAASSPSMVRRVRLSELPGVTIHRGNVGASPTQADAEHEPTTGIPVLDPRVIMNSQPMGPTPERYISVQEAPGLLTEVGDILLMSLVSGRNPAATRFSAAGWAVSRTCYLVRIDPAVSGAPDPDYLVACINASVVELPTLRGASQVMPSRIDIPVLPEPDQKNLADSLRAVEGARREAAATLGRLDTLAGLIESAISTGSVTVTR